MVRCLPALTLLLLPQVALAYRPLDEFLLNVERGGEYAPGELLVRTRPDARREDLERVARKLSCRVDHRFGSRPFYMVLCPSAVPMRTSIERWQEEPIALWVEAGFYDDELEAVPNDLATLQWYHLNTGQAIDMVTGVSGADMGSVDAWDVTPSSPARKIALIDVGIYRNHFDLMNNLWTNPGETCGNFADDDGNGYVDDCYGWDVGDDDNDPDPLSMPEVRSDGSACLRWHATYIAGLAGAEGNNNNGIAGTSWDVQIINIKRHPDSTCRSTTTRTVEAIAYAVDQGADALGFSFSSSSYSSSFESILQQADALGVIAVMSAGNGGSNIDSATRYPNNYSINNKLIVASTDNRDLLDPGSNYGASRVDIAAPGTFVVSTAIENPQAYGVGTGTSMSVGFVLGAVALARTGYPQLTTSQVMASILQGSRYLANLDCGQVTRCVSSSRRLDLDGMFAHASTYFPPDLSLDSLSLGEIGNGDGTLQPGEQARLLLDVTNGGTGPSYASSAFLELISTSPDVSIAVAETDLGTLQPQGSLQAVQGPVFALSSGCTSDFTASFRVTLSDTLANAFAWTFDVDFTCAGVTPVDAGVVDTGTPDTGADTGVPADSGSDAGVDTGLERDAGAEPDAGGEADAGLEQIDSGSPTKTDGGAPLDGGHGVQEPGGRERPSGCTCSAAANDRSMLLGLLLIGVAVVRLRRARNGR